MASISPINFYGKRISPFRPPGSKKQKIYEKYVLKDLLNGPSLIWKTFFKQEKALEQQMLHKGGLMPFVFESENSGRLFLIAHPEVFWHYNSQREIQDRCTYEIIRENTVSKLYFDLEFNKEANPNSDGDQMVKLLIQIVLFYLKKFFKIESSKDQVLDLDSTNNKKFSCHLIFNLPRHAFINNKNVGNFVQKMCTDIKNGIDEFDVKTLFVKDTKDKEILFIDEGVYTKNRHFRCYKNTKKGKNSPLVLSKRNTFKCKNDLEYFLSSLVTYVGNDVNILQFEGTEKIKYPRNVCSVTENTASPYPLVDNFINEKVKPGKIYRSVYFSTSNTIVYDIVNNRYCGNIKRQHKRNNVKYIVNLDAMVFYQKCHDWDCRDYKSEEVALPEEIKKEIRPETSGSDELGLFDLQDDITPEMIELIDSDVKRKLERFPSFGVSDEDFLNLDY